MGKPFYRKMNPNGRVPTIEDDGFVCEIDAIVRYLRQVRRRHALAERSPPARRRALDGLDTSSRAGARPYWGLIRTPPEKRDMAAIEAEAEKSPKPFRCSNRAWRRDHVAGKSFTMGDIPLGTFVHRWYALAVKPDWRVGAYYQRLQQRASYKSAYAAAS